jgi:transposase
MQGKEPSQQIVMRRVYLGIDVSKARLDVYIHPLGRTFAVSNDADGLKRLKKAVADCDVALVVMEATGKFHRLAHRFLHDSGFKVAVVNPARSRKFADALGALAKTDAIDARVLAILGESLRPGAAPPAPESLESLQELIRGRDAAVESRTAVLNQIGASKTVLLIRELKRQLRALETAIANLEAEIRHRIEADPVMARRFQILTSIPGIGPGAAVALIAGLSEIGQLSSKEVAMIVGLAPVAHDSGERRGTRSIRGGRANVRTALYMPANNAARHNPDTKVFYDRLIAKRKLAKVGITAVMRKMLVLANTSSAKIDSGSQSTLDSHHRCSSIQRWPLTSSRSIVSFATVTLRAAGQLSAAVASLIAPLWSVRRHQGHHDSHALLQHQYERRLEQPNNDENLCGEQFVGCRRSVLRLLFPFRFLRLAFQPSQHFLLADADELSVLAASFASVLLCDELVRVAAGYRFCRLQPVSAFDST